jgi:uncharacterized protein
MPSSSRQRSQSHTGEQLMGQIAIKHPEIVSRASKSRVSGQETKKRGKIWIDLDNSPHIPFFAPIIAELEKQGYSVMLTARDCFQVKDLVKLFGLNCAVVGRHYGKTKILKVLGTFLRAAQLSLYAIGEKPDMAVSHGSRAQLVVCKLLRVPNLVIDDYEHSSLLIKPDWLLVPEVIGPTETRVDKERLLVYPGIKEEVYVPQFTPDLNLRLKLGFSESDVLVTVRPPAEEAHYHNLESQALFEATMEYLRGHSEVGIVLLPRTAKQAQFARDTWSQEFAIGKFVIPEQALDGLSLIWWSDLVISGGGTMNREAAALGVPVCSVFRGAIGAVDRNLASTGKLTLLERVEDIPTVINLQRRDRTTTAFLRRDKETLAVIVRSIVKVMELPKASSQLIRHSWTRGLEPPKGQSSKLL